jgi:hypothetical protein
MNLGRTRHATERHQGRATPALFESLLLDHGSRLRRHGADVVFLDKTAKKRLRQELGGDRGPRILERWANTYLVVGDDGRSVTTARCTRRIKRP